MHSGALFLCCVSFGCEEYIPHVSLILRDDTKNIITIFRLSHLRACLMYLSRGARSLAHAVLLPEDPASHRLQCIARVPASTIPSAAAAPAPCSNGISLTHALSSSLSLSAARRRAPLVRNPAASRHGTRRQGRQRARAPPAIGSDGGRRRRRAGRSHAGAFRVGRGELFRIITSELSVV